MARVLIVSDDARTSIEVQQRADRSFGWCEEHREWISDRGHFEDTCEAIANHLDWKH